MLWATVLIGVDAVVLTLGVTGVTSGLSYGGVLSWASGTTEETECIGDVDVHAKGASDWGEWSTGPGYCAHCVEDLWVWASCCIVKESDVLCHEAVEVSEKVVSSESKVCCFDWASEINAEPRVVTASDPV